MNRHIENQLSEMTWDALEKGKGRRFTSKFIEPGIIKYSDDKGQPYVALVKKEAIDRFIGSIIGCPLIIKHHDVNKDTVEDLRCGIISEVTYNQADGWYYCSGIVWDEQAIKNIEEHGWSVSCTYVITDEGEGGIYHDIKYDTEFMNGDFEHLALVENPRYEEATIVLNSKGEPIRKKQNAIITEKIENESCVAENGDRKEKIRRQIEILQEEIDLLRKELDEQDNSKSKNDNGGNAMFQKKSENEKIMEDVKKFISNMKDGIEALCKKVGNEKAKLLAPLTKAMNEAGEAFSVNAKEGDEDDKEKKEKNSEDEKDEKKAKAKKSKSAKNESESEDELEKSKKARNEAPKDDAQATGYMTMAEREKLGKELF
jgi:hypothetical protein